MPCCLPHHHAPRSAIELHTTDMPIAGLSWTGGLDILTADLDLHAWPVLHQQETFDSRGSPALLSAIHQTRLMQCCSVPSIPSAPAVRVVLTMLTKPRLTASCPGGTESATSALVDNSGLGPDGPHKAGPVSPMSASRCVCIKHCSIYGSTLISLCKELGADAGHSLRAIPPVFPSGPFGLSVR